MRALWILLMTGAVWAQPPQGDTAGTSPRRYSTKGTKAAKVQSEEEQAPAQQGVLDASYTLGHITGLSLSSDASLDQQRDEQVNDVETRLRVGLEDRWALDLPMLYRYRKLDRKKRSSYSFPGFRLGLHPTGGLILDGKFGGNNLWGVDTLGPRWVDGDLFFHALSNQGDILLDARTIPFAYYYGPILNLGQMEAWGNLDGQAREGGQVRAYGFGLGLGLAPYTQMWASMENTFAGFRADDGLHNRHEQRSLLGIDWVGDPIRMGAQLTHEDTSGTGAPEGNRLADPESWSLMIYAGGVGGGRSPTAQEVLGNWNGFFTPQMPEGQFDLEDSVFVFPNADGNDVAIRGAARYGISDGATIGMDYDVATGGGLMNSMYMTLCLSNVPVRTRSPAQAGSLEYRLGYLPDSREVRVMMDILMMGKSPAAAGTADILMADPLSPYRASWDSFRRGWTREAEARGSFRIRGTIGMSARLFLTGALSRIDDLKIEDGPLYYHLNEAWVFGLGAGIHTDNVLVQFELSHYAGKKIPEPGVDTYDNLVARFGPVRLFGMIGF